VLSHDLQRHLGLSQTPLSLAQLAPQPSDLGLLSTQPPNLRAGLAPFQHATVTQLAPLGDLRRIQTLAPQIPTTPAVLAGHVIRGQVRQLLGRGERPTRSRTTSSRTRFTHHTIIDYRCKNRTSHRH
jgi:hypothetical protein